MAYCGPSSALPSRASAPVIGLGSTGYGPGGYGYRGLGLGYGYGAAGYGESARNLGTLARVIPSIINQILPFEIIINPPPFVVIIPGPILSAGFETVTVGGNTPSAPRGFERFGGYQGGRLGHLGRHGSIFNLPR